MNIDRKSWTNYYNRATQNDLRVGWYNIKPNFTKTVKRIKNRLPEKGRVLDIGCGRGDFFKYFRKEFPKWKCVGIDISPFIIKKATYHVQGVEWYVGFIEDYNFKNFDLVVAYETLEHVYGLGDVLKKVKQALKPNAFFVGSVPREFEIECDAHLHIFNKRLLRKWLSMYFKVVTIERHPQNKATNLLFWAR